jgi:hypothetical protein
MQAQQNISIEARAGAWDTLMAMWEDPDNAEDLNGGDVVEVLGQLRQQLGYSERSAHEQQAYELGAEHAHNAASWVIDGNTQQEAIVRLVKMMDDGDPELFDWLPREPNLSGELADDPTPTSLYAEIVGTSHEDAEEGAGMAYETPRWRSCRASRARSRSTRARTASPRPSSWAWYAAPLARTARSSMRRSGRPWQPRAQRSRTPGSRSCPVGDVPVRIRAGQCSLPVQRTTEGKQHV